MNSTLKLFAGLAALLLVALLGLRAGPALSQSTNDGSIYSRFGIGELRQHYNSQIAALGGGGYALGSSRYRNMSNPASWSTQILTGIGIGFALENTIATDAADNTSKLSSGSISSLQIGFPIKAQKIGVGLSFAPYTRQGYRVKIQDVLVAPGGIQDDLGYTIDYVGNGGLQRFEAGAGVSVLPNISIGGAVTYTFGVLEEIRETEFDDASFAGTRITNLVRLDGFGLRGGIRGQFNNVARSEDAFMFGVSADLPTTIKGLRQQFAGSEQERDTLGTALDMSTEIPATIAVGVAYAFDSRWLVVADGSFSPWSNFSSTGPLPGYTPGSSVGLEDRTRLSAGVEVFPAGKNAFSPYLSKIAYRVGFFADNSYISPDPDTRINSLGITLGASIPTAVAGTRIDINFEAGNRGVAEDLLIKDRFYKFGLNLNVGERWFVKRRFR